ncbi:hypothetical protein DFS33DRAFT_1291832 [Desarmillaria ectypa]|nr:hypothetical protein DFS33DRAFT_1291832 [Desarmillaria ectypa]
MTSPSPSPPDPEQTETSTYTPEKVSESMKPEESSAESTPAVATPSNGDWQAIFSPQHSAYYFYNAVTGQTTWENPLIPSPQFQPEAAASLSSSSYDAALAAGIDPSLAYLDPSLTAGPSGSVGPYTATAKFNARTGRFTANDARDPSHMSEYERAKRMSEFYFDVGAWEAQRDQQQQEEDVKKRKRPSKKDLVSARLWFFGVMG